MGKSEADLRTRLVTDPKIAAATSFASVRAAESVISDALRANAAQIRAWGAAGKLTRFSFDYDAAKEIGYGVVRVTGKMAKFKKIRVVLEATRQNGKLYFILTSFPIS